jgi:hypothetical protein
MRRLLSVAALGLAIVGSTTVASAQRPGRGQGRAGVMDTARARRMDSLRVAHGDTIGRRLPDSVRQHRMDSLRAAGVLDAGRPGPGRRGGRGPEGMGPGARGRGDMAAARGALAGIKLNDNEKSAVKTITEKYRAEMKELRDANQPASAPSPQLRAQFDAIAQRERADIRAALTAEHQAQFDANIKKQAARGAGRPQPGRRPPTPLRDR